MLKSIAAPESAVGCSAEEWAIRVDLAAAYRLVAHFGWDDNPDQTIVTYSAKQAG